MELTDPQKIIVENAAGHFLVRACPGSGKTFTMAYKTIEDIKAWTRPREGIALLSFTNTAQTELSEEIEKINGRRIEFPHFVGTIDSFINKYIFFPYINLLGFDPEKVEMIGEPYGRYYGWFRSQKCALKLKYALDGTLNLPAGSAREYDAATLQKAKEIKKKVIENHKFTQSDANYYALRILAEYPEIVDIVSGRFPYLYLDEAQDTTPIHWEIIKKLSSHENNERFGVIGDPDQSIYAWNGALPSLFTEYEEELAKKNQVFHLLECRRSSQAICTFYHKFSTLKDIPKAIDPAVASFGRSPTIVSYSSPADIRSLIDAFKTSIPEDDSFLVVSRSLGLAKSAAKLASDNPEAIGGNPFKDNDQNALSLLHAKADLDRGNYRSAIFRAENVAFTILKKYDRELILKDRNISKRDWLTLIEDDLSKLPPTDQLTEAWSNNAATSLKSTSLFNTINFTIKSRGKISYKTIKAFDYFSDMDAEDEIQALIETVHAVKGKTTDHIFVLLDKEQAKRVQNVLGGKKIADSEDKRIFYVAVTRARKSIVLCVPEEFNDALVGCV